MSTLRGQWERGWKGASGTVSPSGPNLQATGRVPKNHQEVA